MRVVQAYPDPMFTASHCDMLIGDKNRQGSRGTRERKGLSGYFSRPEQESIALTSPCTCTSKQQQVPFGQINLSPPEKENRSYAYDNLEACSFR